MASLNERGSSLVVVLMVTLIFSVLGLAVLGATVNHSKRTAIRESEIEMTSSEKVLMSEVLAKLQEDIDSSTEIQNWLKTEEIPPTNYDFTLNEIIKETECYFNDNLGFSCDRSNEKRPVVINELGSNTNAQYEDFIDLNNGTLNHFMENNYIRIFEIKINDTGDHSNNPIQRTVTQNVILSPTPSFLNYAVGTYENALIINGSPDIIGNVYAPTLELNSKAEFYVDKEINPEPQQTGPFYGPSIFGTLYTTKVINNIKNEIPNAPPFYAGDFQEKDDGIKGIPVIKPTGKNFVDMNFNNTFSLKLSDAGLKNLIDLDSGTINHSAVSSIINTCKSDSFFEALYYTDGMVENNRSETGNIDELIGYLMEIAEADNEIRNGDGPRYQNPKFTCGTVSGQKLFLLEESVLETYKDNDENIFKTDIDNENTTLLFTNIDKEGNDVVFKNSHTFTINKNLDLKNYENDKKGWLVVNGNLEIVGGPIDDPVEIKANILVNGNLYIKYDDMDENNKYLKFDSTIYVTGESIVDNVNIEGSKDEETDPDNLKKQLVLISNEELKIVRINEFEDVKEPEDNKLVNLINSPPNLKAFFYTDKKATLYGVGSYFQIEGGVFARQQLVINAIRYNFTNPIIDEAKIADYHQQSDIKSRFYVEYDNRVITDQLSSLPRVDRLQVIPINLMIE